MQTLIADCRFALRVYARTPATSAIAVVGLAIAIAFVGAFLSLYAGLAIKPHPGFESSNRLVTIGQTDGTDFGNISYRLIERIDAEVTSLEAMTGFMSIPLALSTDGEVHDVELVTRRFFSAIRPRLVLGRGFDETDHDPNAEPVAVISDRYWRRQFGGSPNVIGSTIQVTGASPTQGSVAGSTAAAAIDTAEFRIVGVMSPALASLQEDDNPLWLAYERAAPLYLGNPGIARISQQFRGLGLLASNATARGVAAELDDRYADASGVDLSAGFRLDAIPGLVQNISAQREVERQLGLLLAVSLLLALVAAANVSLFLLSRAARRRRELAIRMSVGAPRKRVERQLATEAGLLVVLAALPGITGSYWLASLLPRLSLLRQASWQNLSLLDWRVLAVMLGGVTTIALIVARMPMRDVKSSGLAAGGRQVASRANPTQRIAISLQMAIAGAVGAAAIAMGWYLGALLLGDPGYDSRDIVVVTVGAGPEALQDSGVAALEAVLVERERQRELVLSVPGVDAVAFGSAAPGLNRRGLMVGVPSPSHAGENVPVSVVTADREYFEMLDLKLVEGAVYSVEEIEVMLANETAAELLWGTTAATGSTVPVSISGAPSTRNTGVLDDLSYGHPSIRALPRVYVPLVPLRGLDYLFVHTPLAPSELRTALMALVAAGDLEITLGEIQRLKTLTDDLIAPDRARGLVMIAAALLIVLLATSGSYGTQRYLVGARQREFAIRASLGAGPASLMRLVLRHGLELGLPGVVIGGLLAFTVVAWLRGEYIAETTSPLAVAAAVIVALLAILIAAGVGPARQAGRMQPAPLLRQE
jgi:putative ABC transport system permease protein